MNARKQSKIKTLERVVGQLGIDLRSMGEFLDGYGGELAQAIYTNNMLLGALIKYLKVDQEALGPIVAELEAEATAKREAEQKAREEKRLELAAQQAVDGANTLLSGHEAHDIN